jgi:DNA adenine methylase
MSDKLIAFGYYGGKYSHLDWLLPLLPTQGITHYCEPFAGSGAVLINREPSLVETYNDLDGEVVNFFRVLREQKDVLIAQLELTPFSRLEYVQALNVTEKISDLERARRFYIRARQTMLGLAQSASPGRWAYCIEPGGTAVQRWNNGIPKLADVANRLLRVQIENLPALDIINRYDTPNTLFYIDPPYVFSTRNGASNEYSNELTDDDHSKLAQALMVCRGKVAVSGYDGGLYRDLYKGWHMTAEKQRISWASPDRAMRQEVLWTNYDPAAIHSVSDLPLFAARPA